MTRRRFDLTDFEWSIIQPLLPNKPRGGNPSELLELVEESLRNIRPGRAGPKSPQDVVDYTPVVNSRDEMDLRNLVKARFVREGLLDSWAIHSATKLGIWKRKQTPEGTAVFGGRQELERRRKGLTSREEWRRKRLHPFVSFGDRQKTRGNQNIHLTDETTIIVKIGRKEKGGRSGKTVRRTAKLNLSRMTGNCGIIMRQLAAICANEAEADRINVGYAINDTHVSVTFDPTDLPNHPQRRRPVVPTKGRALGIDLNPNWIGVAVAANVADGAKVEETELLDHALVKLDMAIDASPELVRETLAAVCDPCDLDGAKASLRHDRTGEGTGQVAVERQESLAQQALELLGKNGVRADADASLPVSQG
jgi:hypothetical protein